MTWIYTLTFKNELTVQIKKCIYLAYTLFLIHSHVIISAYLLLIFFFVHIMTSKLRSNTFVT